MTRKPYDRDYGAHDPTPKQIAYLRSLATETGETFAWPPNRRSASQRIDELRLIRKRQRRNAARVS